MDRIQELLTRLADLSDAEIAELEGLILSEFDSAEAEEPTAASVDRMVSLADALDSVRGEVGRRNTQAEELAKKAAEASSRVRSDAAPEAEMGMKDEEDDELPAEDQIAEDIEQVTEDVVEAVEDAEAAGEEEEEKNKFSDDTPAEAELSDESDTSSTEESTTEELSDSTEEPATEAELQTETESTSTSDPEENAVTASIEGDGVVVTPPADAAPVPTALSTGVTMTITAGADIPGYGTGAELSDMDKVADAFAKRLHTLRNVQGGSGTQHTVATLSFEFPEDRRLAGDDPSNITRVNKVISPQALTAAAGICAPLETIYDVSICGDADRPIRDALARFNADRGGIKIYGSPALADDCGVGIWDPANAAAKTCCDAVCPTPQEIGLEAIYACMKFSNYTNRFFPEVIKANTDLAMINHARMAEMNLLKQIKAASSTLAFDTGKTGFKVPSKVGLVRHVMLAVDNAAAYLRRKHRLATNAPMRIILPSWLGDAMAADLSLQMPGDGLETLSISDAKIASLFRERGINVTWSLDVWDVNAASIATNLVRGGFDDTVGFPIFPEGTFLFLDGGTLDLGVQRDATMIGANEYATFVETFEGLAMTGCEALWITMPVCVSGAAAALVDTAC